MRSVLLILITCFLYSCKESPTPISKASPDQIHDASVESLQMMMQDGSLTAVDLVEYYLDRIKKIDSAGPKLNAVMIINPDAKEIAKALDKERTAGNVRGPMHGIPIMIKDNIDSADKMPNTGGSLLLKNNFPKQDAFIVKQLREAGAILLGKTNLSEWANFRSTSSSSGWSSAGGQTLNAYNNDKSPCGSSAGSGVAVSADFCAMAIGTETDGSIQCPSAVNGIVGIKPTVGLWSRSGIIPISYSQDTPGPMAKTVKDAATFLSICTGVDAKDDKTKNQNAKDDYKSYCKSGTLKGKRIGVDTNFMNIDGEMGEVFGAALEDLRKSGAEIIPLPYRNALKTVGNNEYEVLLYEFKDGLNKYLAGADLPYNTLSDLIAANEKAKDTIMPIFGQEIFEMANKKGSIDDEAFTKALEASQKRAQYVLDSVMAALNLDALAGPALGPSWDINHKDGDSFNGPSAYSPAAQSGYPSISVPMGFVDDLPVSLLLMGGAYQEGALIGMAYDYEQNTMRRVAPEME